MNYVKTFDIRLENIEETLNPSFEEMAKKNHRVMHVHFYTFISREDWVFVTVIVNDAPHCHKKL